DRVAGAGDDAVPQASRGVRAGGERTLRPRPPAAHGRRRHAGDGRSRSRLRRVRGQVAAAADAPRRRARGPQARVRSGAAASDRRTAAVPVSAAAARRARAAGLHRAPRRRAARRHRRSRADARPLRGRRPPVARRAAPVFRAVRRAHPPAAAVIFHSFDFVVFFVVVVAIYWRLPRRGQNALLLASSYFFYGYVHPWFLLLIASSTTIDYLSARGMERWPARKWRFMALSIVSNFGMLGFFKYVNFFADNVQAALAAAGFHVSVPVLRVILPVGISFYTFQAMSYTVDVFRGELRARRSLLDVAVFISFFPHLVAGPIRRASYLLPQVEGGRRFSVRAATTGLSLMVWGFFKKLVIADNVGVIANKVFALRDPSFEILWAGVFAFAIQIYADF